MTEIIAALKPYDMLLSCLLALGAVIGALFCARYVFGKWSTIIFPNAAHRATHASVMGQINAWHDRTFTAGRFIKSGSPMIRTAIYAWSFFIPIAAWVLFGASEFGSPMHEVKPHPVFWHRILNLLCAIGLAVGMYQLFIHDDDIKHWSKETFGKLVPGSRFLSFLLYGVCNLGVGICVLGPLFLLMGGAIVNLGDTTGQVAPITLYSVGLAIALIFPLPIFWFLAIPAWTSPHLAGIDGPMFLLILPVFLEIATTVSVKYTNRHITGAADHITRPMQVIMAALRPIGVGFLCVIGLWLGVLLCFLGLDAAVPRVIPFDVAHYLRDIAQGQGEGAYLLVLGSIPPLVPALLVVFSGLLAVMNGQSDGAVSTATLTLSLAYVLVTTAVVFVALYGVLLGVALVLL